MSANTTPIFPLTPRNSWCKKTTANVNYDGTGANVSTAFTAGVNGSRIDKIVMKSLGTNQPTVARFFINNGLDSNDPSNNALFTEQTLSATSSSSTISLGEVNLDYSGTDVYLPAGYKLNVTLGTATSPGWQFTVFGSDY